MKGLSKLPDEFFEEYGKLDRGEQFGLYELLGNADLPSLLCLTCTQP